MTEQRVDSKADLVQVLERHFGEYARAHSLEPTTVAGYRQALRRLTKWLRGSKRPPKDVGMAFRAHLVKRGYAPQTINTTLGMLSSYFGFLAARAGEVQE